MRCSLEYIAKKNKVELDVIKMVYNMGYNDGFKDGKSSLKEEDDKFIVEKTKGQHDN